MNIHAKTDLIVIGGGVMGAFHAYHALRKGLSVRLFERHQHPMGASVRNFGQIVPSGMNSSWQLKGRRSLEIYQQLQQETDLTITQKGSIYLASDQEEMGLLEELREINEQAGYPSLLLTAQKCLSRYDGLKSSYVQGGLYFPAELSVDPRQLVKRLLHHMKKKYELACHLGTRVQEIESANGSCFVTDHKGVTYKSAKVILCSGEEFQTLYPHIFEQGDLELSKLQMMETLPQRELRIPGNVLTGLSIRRYESFRECPSYKEVKDREEQNSPLKQWGIHILLKQSTDGSVIIGDSHEYADAQEAQNLDFFIREDIQQYILGLAREIFDLDTWRINRSWYGIYSQCKSAPVFTARPEPDIHIFTGIGGKGMTASPGYAWENIEAIF